MTRLVIGAAIEVHRALGPGLLESAYEACLCRELVSRGASVRTQVPVPLFYKGTSIPCVYRADMVVNNRVLLEIKVVEAITDVHVAQVLTYLRLLGIEVGLLLNFNAITMARGIRRLINSA